MPPIILALAKVCSLFQAVHVDELIVLPAQHPLVDKYDLSHLKGIISGAAPMGAELEEAAAKRLGYAIRYD